MVANILDGKAVAAELKEELKRQVQGLQARGVVPGLATVLVGQDPASQIYVRNKHRACQELGMASFHVELAQDSSKETVLRKIDELNGDARVHGILVQMPLPPQIPSQEVLLAVRADKDADGFHPQNLGRLFAAKSLSELQSDRSFVPLPCTPHGILHLLKKTGLPLAGANAVVLGRSMIVGKPASALLLAQDATVTIVHSKTQNLIEYCKRADILVAAIGQPLFLTGEMVRAGAVVIDVGINRLPDGSLCGDVHFKSVVEKAAWITPVPGGVGPMTIVLLMQNTIRLAEYAK